jgi:hypothetical protein
LVQERLALVLDKKVLINILQNQKGIKDKVDNFIMNKLCIFGDSFSHGHGFNDSDPFYEVTLSDDIDKRYWCEIVADELNLELHNHANVGASNDYILDTILNNADKIGENDYVVIQAAYYSRFDVPHKSSFSF